MTERSFTHSDVVAEWGPAIRQSRLEAGLLCSELPTWAVLSLIHVESRGKPCAHRDGSQFYGLMQMGRAAGMDVGFDDEDRETTAELDCNGRAALGAFMSYYKRYQKRLGEPDMCHMDHLGDPMTHLAVLWKGGPGTLKLWRSLEDDDDDIPPEDEEEFQKGWRVRVPVYVDWFWRAAEVWDG